MYFVIIVFFAVTFQVPYAMCHSITTKYDRSLHQPETHGSNHGVNTVYSDQTAHNKDVRIQKTASQLLMVLNNESNGVLFSIHPKQEDEHLQTLLISVKRKRRKVDNNLNSTTSLPSVSSTPLANSTSLAINKHFKRQDGATAMVCIGAIVFLLLVVILYSRMWKDRHKGWEYLRSEHSDTPLTVSNFSFKELLKSKTRLMKQHIEGQARKLTSKRHKQKFYHKLDTIGEKEGSESEDEVYSR